MVATAVVSVEKCFKGFQKLWHFLLQPIFVLDIRAQFKEILVFHFCSLDPTVLRLQGSLRIQIYRSFSVPNGYKFIFFWQYLEKH